jgi:hypothetical protein
MKKIIISTLLIVLLLISACGHYGSIINFLNCIFYGECSDFYYTGGSTTAQLVAFGENTGITLDGAWENKNSDNSYILTFENDGVLNIALYDDDKNLERYDLGKYSLENDKMTIGMNNGTYSVVTYSIKNKTLLLKSFEEEKSIIKTAE